MAGHAEADADEAWTDDRIRQLLPGAHHNLDFGRISGYLQELSADEHFTYMLDRILVGIDAERSSDA